MEKEIKEVVKNTFEEQNKELQKRVNEQAKLIEQYQKNEQAYSQEIQALRQAIIRQAIKM